MLAGAALLKKAAAQCRFSHLETKQNKQNTDACARAAESSGAGGHSDGGEGGGEGRMAAYRRLGKLQSIARKHPDLETGDVDIETFFDGGEEEEGEEGENAVEGLYYGDTWSVDVTFDKRTGRAVAVKFEEDDDGQGSGKMVANAKVSALLQRMLREDDWATFAEEIDLLVKRTGGGPGRRAALAPAVKVIASVSARSGWAVRERSTTSEVAYLKSRRCVGYTKLALIDSTYHCQGKSLGHVHRSSSRRCRRIIDFLLHFMLAIERIDMSIPNIREHE